ncbi:MAG: sulfatase/phosphatase domain-containing protein, partial [Cyclobacteriaceae bacterium]
PYEMGIRTPFMLRWSGTVQPKMDTVTQVSNIDIVPTILAAAGLTAQKPLPGVNLLSEEDREARDIVFAEAYEHDIADIEAPTRSLQYRIAIEYPWKLMVPDTNNVKEKGSELFNLQNDPEEIVNQATINLEKREYLLRRLDQWWSPKLN